MDVWEREDIDGLIALLREDAVLRMPPQRSVAGAREIVAFFCDVAGLRRIRLSPTRANGRPAVTMHLRTPDGALVPHGVLVLETDDAGVTGLQAFIDGGLVPLFEA